MYGTTMFADGNLFQPRHITFVSYPDLSLVNRVSEKFALVSVHAAQSRYSPNDPLIDDPAVQAHAEDKSDARRFCSVVKASIPLQLDNAQISGSNHAFDINRLAEDMINAARCNGKTSLSAVTHVLDTGWAHDEDDVEIRVVRHTLFCLRGSRSVRALTYNFTLNALDNLETVATDSTGLWLKNLIDRIRRRTNMAFIRVQTTLALNGMQEVWEPGWLPSRQPDYQQVLSPMMVKGEVPNDGEENDCRICWETLEVGEVVQVPCAGPVKHRYHMSCLIKVCEAFGPEKSSCPLCRQLLIEKQADIDLLKYGCIGKEYVVDSKYSEWENWERSCADVDKHLAENIDELITVSRVLLKGVFAKMVEGALKEPAVSTATNLQLVRCAEFRLLELAVLTTSRAMERMQVQSRTLFNAIMNDLLDSATAAFKTGGLVPTLDHHELAEWAGAQHAVSVPLRPGYYSCAEKLVSRTLEFVRLRRRNCTYGGFGKGFHNHGGRAYYNPEAPAFSRR